MKIFQHEKTNRSSKITRHVKKIRNWKFFRHVEHVFTCAKNSTCEYTFRHMKKFDKVFRTTEVPYSRSLFEECTCQVEKAVWVILNSFVNLFVAALHVRRIRDVKIPYIGKSITKTPHNRFFRGREAHSKEKIAQRIAKRGIVNKMKDGTLHTKPTYISELFLH